MKRKIFAAFLSLMMVISMLPTSAFATEVEIPADCQHENAHWETVKEATCTEPGKQVLHCHECEKDLEEKEIPALGHDLQPTGEFEDPTCTKGAGEVYACSRCDYAETKVIEGDAAIPALGHDMKETVVAATCKEGGYTLHECTRCDYSFKDNETKADENAHVSVLREPALKPATCTTTGIGQYICQVCGKSLGYKVIPAGHKWVETAREDATCGKDGKVTYACANCDETKEEVLPATGKHTFVDGETIDATCTENAKVGQVCSVCGAAGETVEVPDSALGHDMVADEKNSLAATCEKAGVEAKKCSRCDHTETKEIPALGHKWKSAGMQEADCTNPAGEKFVCENDPEHTKVVAFEGTLAVPAKGHTPKAIPAVPANCTETGLTEGSECAVCHKILVEQKETPVDESKHVEAVAATLKEATCTTTGIARMECQLCGKNLGYKVIADGHDWSKEMSRVDATCAKDGKVTWGCSKCDATKEEVLPATGKHDYKETFVDATCTSNAKAGFVCTVCGAEKDVEEIPGTMLEHELKVDEKASKAATCEEDGVEVLKCANCDYTESKTIKALGHDWESAGMQEADCTNAAGEKFVCKNDAKHTKVVAFEGELAQPAKGHTPKAVPAVEATCSATGLTEGSVCAVCGETLVAQKETPIDESKHVESVAATLKEATCTTTGIARMECSLCHKNLGYKVLKAEHKWVETSNVPATCGKDGKVTLKCSVCQETDEKVLPATGEHTFTAENVKAVDATCTENAKVIELCTVCGAEGKTTEVENTALGHDYKLDEKNEHYKPATCEEDGLATLKCSRCGDTKEEVIEAEGAHKWDEANAKNVPATCTEDEHLLIECAVCHATKTQAYPDGIGQKALGHDLKKDVTPATCAKEGYTTVTCSRCDYHEITDKTPVDANNHTWNITHLKDATCTVTGIDRRVCADCGKSEYVVAEKLAHTYDDSKAVVTKEPTCAEEGEISNTCTVCGKTDVIGKVPNDGIDHTPVEIPETDEMTAGWKCSVCGKILVEPESKCAHKNTETLAKVEPTCTETGLTEGKKCADCGKVLVAQETIPAAGHTEEVIAAVEPTCTATGLTEGKKCSVCGVTLVEQDVLAALGHAEEVLEGVAPTCETAGKTAGVKCSRCGEILKAQEDIAPKGHTSVEVPAVEATCETAGKTAGTKCADCDKILSGCEDVPALGHDYQYVEDGEDEEGLWVKYVCTRCHGEKIDR